MASRYLTYRWLSVNLRAAGREQIKPMMIRGEIVRGHFFLQPLSSSQRTTDRPGGSEKVRRTGVSWPSIHGIS
jgi:hypothetical protein